MSAAARKFLETSEERALDKAKKPINGKSVTTFAGADSNSASFANLEYAKRKAHVIKWRAIENLDKFLPEFESNFQKRGGKVIWANDAAEANAEICGIIERAGAENILRSQSSTLDEIALNPFLSIKGINVSETAISNYAFGTAGQQNVPVSINHSHTKDTFADVSEKADIALDDTSVQAGADLDSSFRQKYLSADVAITGANFLVADTGSVAITDNEGNTRLATSFAKIHIVVAGIEKVLPNLADLHLFWPLLSSHATGRGLEVHNTLYNGPRRHNEADGPEEMYVVLLDNGRTNLLAQKEQRQGLYCIRCGACLNVCPVYKHIGYETYNTTYGGPIGSVITPHQSGMQEFKHLSNASTLCGACTEVCPVKINIHQMLLLNRRDAVKQHLVTTGEKMAWSVFTKAALSRKFLDFFKGGIKNLFIKNILGRIYKTGTGLPWIAQKSFNTLFKEQTKNDNL